jgi:hypothetical protein
MAPAIVRMLIESEPSMRFNLHQLILQSFKPFGEVELRCLGLPDSVLLNQVTPNKIVKSLVLHDIWFEDDAQLIAFFSIFPTISKLHLSSVDFSLDINDFSFQKIIEDLKNLQHLTVSNPSYELGIFRSESLTTLKLKSLDASNPLIWNEFVDNNPKLQALDIGIGCNGRLFEFNLLLAAARDGMKLTIRGDFKLTISRLRSFKEHSSKGIALKVPKSSLMVSMEEFAEIMGDQMEMVEFV